MIEGFQLGMITTGFGVASLFFLRFYRDTRERLFLFFSFAFAMLSLGDLRLLLSAPGGGPGGGKAMPDGQLPEPGGWNRFQIEVGDLEEKVRELRDLGASFRNELVEGVGGKQILLEDPAGNLIELFEPTLPEASMSSHA